MSLSTLPTRAGLWGNRAGLAGLSWGHLSPLLPARPLSPYPVPSLGQEAAVGETIFTLRRWTLGAGPSSGNTGVKHETGGEVMLALLILTPAEHFFPAQLIPTSTPSQFLRQAVAGAPRCVDPSALSTPPVAGTKLRVF